MTLMNSLNNIATLSSSQASVGRGRGGRAIIFRVLVAVQLVSLHFLLGSLREQVRHRDLLARHVGNALYKKRNTDQYKCFNS